MVFNTVLFLCFLSFLSTCVSGKTPGQVLDDKFEEVQKNLSDIIQANYTDLENKYHQLEEDLKVFKIIHGACAPCLALHGSNQCDCRNLEAKKDCHEFRQAGVKVNGLYKILASKFTSGYAYCDQTTQGGGWTVIQRRKDGSEDFYRNWNDYKNGFGNLEGEFWFGNENIHDLTANNPKKSSLLINMVIYGQTKPIYARYGKFKIGDENSKYKLEIGAFSGNTTDKFAYHNNMKFSTKDQDNDLFSDRNCATAYSGGWWYGTCYHTHLNGLYAFSNDCKNINWSNCSIRPTFTEMKVRRNI